MGCPTMIMKLYRRDNFYTYVEGEKLTHDEAFAYAQKRFPEVLAREVRDLKVKLSGMYEATPEEQREVVAQLKECARFEKLTLSKTPLIWCHAAAKYIVKQQERICAEH